MKNDPTHRCRVCGALWRFTPASETGVGDGWNLRSPAAGPCCDNVPMGEQIELLTIDGKDIAGFERSDVAAALRGAITATKEHRPQDGGLAICTLRLDEAEELLFRFEAMRSTLAYICDMATGPEVGRGYVEQADKMQRFAWAALPPGPIGVDIDDHDRWQVLRAAATLRGTFDFAEVLCWYYEHKIFDLGGRTANEAVRIGRKNMVLAYIESLSAGATG